MADDNFLRADLHEHKLANSGHHSRKSSASMRVSQALEENRRLSAVASSHGATPRDRIVTMVSQISSVEDTPA